VTQLLVQTLRKVICSPSMGYNKIKLCMYHLNENDQF